MKRAALLFVYSLKRARTFVIATALLLAALQLVLIFVAGAIQLFSVSPKVSCWSEKRLVVLKTPHFTPQVGLSL